MLQEEITQKTVMLSVNTSKLTARLLAKMINNYLNEQKKHSMQPKQGKLISCGARLAPFDIKELRELTEYDELQLDRLGEEKSALFVMKGKQAEVNKNAANKHKSVAHGKNNIDL